MRFLQMLDSVKRISLKTMEGRKPESRNRKFKLEIKLWMVIARSQKHTSTNLVYSELSWNFGRRRLDKFHEEENQRKKRERSSTCRRITMWPVGTYNSRFLFIYYHIIRFQKSIPYITSLDILTSFDESLTHIEDLIHISMFFWG